MYAIIRDRGRQYTVREGEELSIDLLAQGSDDSNAVDFDEVLLVSAGETVEVGCPTVSAAKVTATVVEHEVLGPKIEVMRFRRRKGSQTKQGHRQRYTRVKIDRIEFGGESGE